MKKSFLLFAGMMLCALASAQFNFESIPFENRYHMLDKSELLVPRVASKAFVETLPPVGNIRAIAEWEPNQAVMIGVYTTGTSTQNFGVPYTLIAQLSQYVPVITVVESSAAQTSVTNTYNSNGVNISNCSFVIAPLDSYWARDYSPWFIMIDNSEVAIIDFPYNRPSRPNDDNVPVVMASHLGVDLYGMNVMHTGGNYMCDGIKMAAMTDLVIDENDYQVPPYTYDDVDTLFKQYMGVTNNYITTDPLGDYIKHIDCWGKIIDVDKIIIASVPTTNVQYSEYEAMAAYWANEVSSWGNNYQVYRVYEPSGQPYSNGLLMNKKYFMPTTSSTPNSNDLAAMAVYQQALPGYQIIGIYSSSWASTDALHCRTHEVADKGMLYVQHQPTLDAQPLLSQYTINANVYALSGGTVLADSAWVKYSVNNGSWNQISMTHPSGNLWTCNIPAPSAGDTIEYFIHASDNSPRSQTHPLIGAPDPHKFWIPMSASVPEKESPLAIVFPNPAVDEIFIQMEDCNAPDVSISLVNLLGIEVLSFNGKNNCSSMMKYNVSGIAPGSYMLQIRSGEKMFAKKMMIIH
ncbi:MAG: agmatine deiminase family protein [Bacteroidota bacterium]